MTVATIDTCVWVHLADRDKPLYASRQRNIQELPYVIECLLNSCSEKGIKLRYSSRLLNYDAALMNPADRQRIQSLLSTYEATELGSAFRLGGLGDAIIGPRGSALDGSDVLSGPRCDPALIKGFISVFGLPPNQRPASNTGKKKPNWIGDYDALRSHYLAGFDVFVTTDTKEPCFTPEKRERAKAELGLIICSPSEALTFFETL